MHKNSFYISFGIWIAILPFLGIPGSWRDTLVSLSGLFLILTFGFPIVLEKLHTKPKPKKKQEKTIPSKENVAEQELRFSETKEDN